MPTIPELLERYATCVTSTDVDGIVALIKGGPEPELGRKLIDFLLSKDAEEMLARLDSAQIPLRGDVPRPDHVVGPPEFRAMKVDWETLKQKQPFFQVYNFTDSHESRAHGSVENTTHKPENTKLRKYHPDLPAIRKNYAKYHDAMKRMDDRVGKALGEDSTATVTTSEDNCF